MMVMCWKYLVPLAFVNLLGTAAWMVAFPHGAPAARIALCALTAALLVAFAWRVGFHLRRAGLHRDELSFNPLATARSPRGCGGRRRSSPARPRSRSAARAVPPAPPDGG